MRVVGLLFGIAVTVCPFPADGLSLCTDGDGRQILTDTPAQFLRCTSIDTERSPTVPASPAPPAHSEPHTEPPLAEPVNHTPLFTAAHATVLVPLERVGGLLILTAHLNHDRRARLILDTGASHSLLSHKIAQDLGLFSRPPVALVTLQTVGGSVQAEVVQVESIELAGAEVRQSLAAVHDMPDAPPGVEGLLGQSFLRQFEVTVNAAKGELRLKAVK